MINQQRRTQGGSTVPEWLRRDHAWEEQKARLWAMTPDERVRAMRAGKLSLRLCLHWASRASHEVPLVDGEWAFLSSHVVDVVERRGHEHLGVP